MGWINYYRIGVMKYFVDVLWSTASPQNQSYYS
ncbi:hypothetical protein [Catenibacterium sp.]